MEQFKVKILHTAQTDMADMADIVDYLNTLSPQTALRYYDLLTEKIAGLSEMPGVAPQCVMRNSRSAVIVL
jgi:plasmid stabilization system protein ParE